MWLISGPFDGDVRDATDFQKTRALKAGTSYGLGRKGLPFTINNGKISKHHCEFIVGEAGEDAVSDPASRPTLEYVNKKDKPMKIIRGKGEQMVNPGSAAALEDGDCLQLVTNVMITIKWEQICCFQPSKGGKAPLNQEMMTACANFGVYNVLLPTEEVTHHLTSSFAPTCQIATSLISACHLVKPEWLAEVLKLAAESEPITESAPKSFTLPPPTKFRPTFSSALEPEYKAFKVWEPNEERLKMFKDLRFLFVGEKRAEGGIVGKEMRELIKRAEGAIDTFDIHDGTDKLRRALTRAKAKQQGIVLVASKSDMESAVGRDEWNAFREVAREFDLFFKESMDINHSVLQVDPSILLRGAAADALEPASQVQDQTPSQMRESVPHVPSQSDPSDMRMQTDDDAGYQPTRRRLPPRRAASRQPSAEPSIPAPVSDQAPPESQQAISERMDEELAPRKRKPLTRRVNAGVPILTGLDDDTIVINAAIASLEAANAAASASTPAVHGAASASSGRPKLKRRAGRATSSEPPLMNLSLEDDIDDDRPLKKYRSLYESLGKELVDPSQLVGISSALPETQTETQLDMASETLLGGGTVAGTTLLGRTNTTRTLPVLLEEEESQSSSTHPLLPLGRGRKRVISAIEEEDEDMQGVEEALAPTSEPSNVGTTFRLRQPPKKRRTIESVSDDDAGVTDSQRPPDSAIAGPSTITRAPGVAPGQPDTDTQFLAAISDKKGKQDAPDFDPDFERTIQAEQEKEKQAYEEEWKVLEDFGDDSNLRGNFMIIETIDVYKYARGREQELPRAKGTMRPEWEGRPNYKKFKKKADNKERREPIKLHPVGGESYGLGDSYYQKMHRSQSRSQEESNYASQHPVVSLKGTAKPTITVQSGNDSDSGVQESVKPTRSKTSRNKPSSRAGSTVPASPKAATRSTRSKAQPLFLSDADESQHNLPDTDSADPSTLSSTRPISPRSTKTKAPTKGKKRTAKIAVADDDSDGGGFRGFGS